MQARLLAIRGASSLRLIADEKGLINWEFGAVDGYESPAQCEEVKKLRVEEKVRVFLFTPLLKGMECPYRIEPPLPTVAFIEQVIPLLNQVKLKTLKRGRHSLRLKVLAADKGYDSKQQRAILRKLGIRPQIPRASLEN